MPISELLRDRKVTPDQLAFPNQLDGGGAGRAVTYQQQVQQFNETIVNNLTINEATELVRGEVKQRANAERRAKEAVASWHGAFRYEIGATMTITYDTWTQIPYTGATIATPSHKTFTPAANNVFGFQATAANEGIWWLYANLSLSLSPVTQPEYAKLAIFKNGGPYSMLDAMDSGISGDQIDWILRGGDHVSIKAGDVVSFAVFVQLGTPGSEVVNAPTALYGYCTGSRQACKPSGGAPNYDGQAFAFVP